MKALATATIVLTLLAGSPAAPAGGRFQARVTGNVDGDTVRLDLRGHGVGGSRARDLPSRIIGVDAPEVHLRTQCYGRQAAAFTRSRLWRGRRVRVRFGAEPRDRYGRALVYIWLPDGRFFNRLLAARGYAYQLTIPPNDRYAGLIGRAVAAARRHGRGLWAPGACRRHRRPHHGPGGSRDKDCSDFRTQHEAQKWFDSHGGSRTNDVASLDADHDGRACESLP